MTLDQLASFLFWMFMGGGIYAALTSFWCEGTVKLTNQCTAIVLTTLAVGVFIAMLVIR